MGYLITDVDVIRKDKSSYLRTYLTDLEKTLGPLCIRWHDYHISEPLSPEDAEDVLWVLQSRGIHSEVRSYSRKKQVVHARGDLDVPSDLEEIFRRQTPSDMIRLSFSSPRQCLELAPDIVRFLDLQREAHFMLRNLHEDALDSGNYKRNLKDGLSSLGPLVADADRLLKDVDPRNYACLSKDNLTLLGFLGSAKGTRKVESRMLTHEDLDGLIFQGRLALTDIELGDYDTVDPFIYLDTFVHFDEGSTTGKVFSLYPIGSETLDTEDGPVPFVCSPEQDSLRREIARYRFEKDFIFIGGHNIAGFDEQKCLNPRRKKQKGRLGGDGIFRVSVDNTEPRYHADSGGLEILRLNGAFLIDTYRIARNYFNDLMPDTKLETVMQWFNAYVDGFYDFEKSYRSYSDVEHDRRGWADGDHGKGIKLSRYCYYDSKAPLFLVKELAPVLLDLAEKSGSDLFRASFNSPEKLAENFWDRKAFASMNRVPYRRQKERKDSRGRRKYLPADDTLVEIISDTDVASKWSMLKHKKRLVERYASRWSTARKGLFMSYLPLFEDLIAADKTRHNNPLLDMMYMKFDESKAIDPIVDAKAVHRGDMPDVIFFARYGLRSREFLSSLEERLVDRLSSLPPLAACTGNLVFTEEPFGGIDLGRADLIRIYDTYRTRIKPPVAFIYDVEGRISKSGISVPSRKKREDFDPLQGGMTYLEIKFVYDFLETYFTGGIRDAINLMDYYSKGIMDFDPYDYLITSTRLREYYQDQNTFRHLVFEEFDVKVKESITYAVGSLGGEDYVCCMDDKVYFRDSFRPMESFYRNLVFGGFKDDELLRTNLFRIISSICFPGKKSEVQDEMQAYHNLKQGNASQKDIDILCLGESP